MARGAAVLLAAAAASGADPFAPGAYSVTSASGKTAPDIKWSYNAWAPEANGTFPVIVFVTGGGGIAPGLTYSTIGKAVAAKGAVFVALWRLAAPAPNKDAELLAAAIPWLRANLPAGVGAAADWDKVALSGHSAGNHVFVQYLQEQCGIVKAAIMIDPVDGYDPFGIEKIYCITPGQKTQFDAPALLIRTGLDPVVKTMVACAPTKLSNDRFYNAWAGPIWMANATGYGHLDACDDGINAIAGVICAADKLPKPAYHAEVAGLVSSFLSLVFGGDAGAERALLDAAAMPVDTVALHDYNGHAAPFAARCTHA